MSLGSDGLGGPAGAEVELPVEGSVDEADLLDEGDFDTAIEDDRATMLLDNEDAPEGLHPFLAHNEDKISAQQVAALRIDPTVDVYAPDLDKALVSAALERKWRTRLGGAVTKPLRAVLRTVLEQLTDTCGVAKKELSDYVAEILAE